MAFRDDREHLRAKANALENELAQTREELAATKRELQETKSSRGKTDGALRRAWAFVFSGIRFGPTAHPPSRTPRRGFAESALATIGSGTRLLGIVLVPLMFLAAIFGGADDDDLGDIEGPEPDMATTAEERHQTNVLLGGVSLVLLLAVGGTLLAWYLN